MTTITLSPIRPDFRRMDLLSWSVRATRFSVTEVKGKAPASIQGIGHNADVARQLDLLSTWTAEDLAAYSEYTRVMEAQKR